MLYIRFPFKFKHLVVLINEAQIILFFFKNNFIPCSYVCLNLIEDIIYLI